MVFSVMEKAKAQFADLEVREWNLAEHPELGPRYGVTTAPAIVVNGRLEFRSVPADRTLRERLATIARTDEPLRPSDGQAAERRGTSVKPRFHPA